MGQPIEGSNPSLSATPSQTPMLGQGERSTGVGRRVPTGAPYGGVRDFAPFVGRAVRGCYDSRAVLGGELAVPCTCNPLQQG